jgi:hypothetical protein
MLWNTLPVSYSDAITTRNVWLKLKPLALQLLAVYNVTCFLCHHATCAQPLLRDGESLFDMS